VTSSSPSISLDYKDFDAFVIGSGLGGAAAAWALSKKGYKVAVFERGMWPLRNESDWTPQKILIQSQYASKKPTQVEQLSRKAKDYYFNENVGGMSVFYGGAAFRFREEDFSSWPCSYQNFEAYYQQAEEALTVHGASPGSPYADIYSPARKQNYPFTALAFTQPSQRIYDTAQKLGLRPSVIPLALKFTNQPRCLQCRTCDGYPCKIEAKSEACTSFLQNADPKYLTVITNAEIDFIEFSQNQATHLHFIDRKNLKRHRLELHHRPLILAAGALNSPAILLRSQLAVIKNPGRLDLIGKRLMRHCNAVVAGIFPFATNAKSEFQKQVAIFDFYHHHRRTQGHATGVIQDIYTPSAEVLAHFSPLGLKTISQLLTKNLQSLLCIAEDAPSESNFVGLEESKSAYGMQRSKIYHQYSKQDLERRHFLLKQAKRILKKSGAWLTQVMLIDSFSHAVGTLCFGNRRQDSVLDENCKLWGSENLWVLDGSFFKTSAGVNPSLTITANSLRVVELEFKNKSQKVLST